jgi:hypothetical protein
MTEQSERDEPRSWNDNLKSTAGSQSNSSSARGAPVTKKPSIGQRWSNAQPTKMTVVWACLASIALTLLIGFVWGGWVTSAKAETMAASAAKVAVVERLAPICVAQFNADPDKTAKFGEMSAMTTFQTAKYVQEQGWATITGVETPDRQVADACLKLLLTP